MWPANSRTAPAASRSRLCRSTDPRRLPTPTNSTRVLARESAQQVVEANIVPYPSTPPVLSPQLWFTSTLACTRPSHMDPSPGTAMRIAHGIPGLAIGRVRSCIGTAPAKHSPCATRLRATPNRTRPSGLRFDKHDRDGKLALPWPYPNVLDRPAWNLPAVVLQHDTDGQGLLLWDSSQKAMCSYVVPQSAG